MKPRKDIVWEVSYWSDLEHTYTNEVEIVALTGVEARNIWEFRNPGHERQFRDYKRLTPLDYEETEDYIDGLEWTQDKNFRESLMFILHSINKRTKANEKS